LTHIAGDHELRPYVSGLPESIVYRGDGSEDFVIRESPPCISHLVYDKAYRVEKK